MSANRTALHVLVIFVLSASYESLFVGYGLNLIDDAWPLWAVKQIEAGGSLYRDVLFVFPPGHLIPAWVGYSLDPPGLVLARVVYAAFAVALSITVYFLASRLMTRRFALAASLCIAVAAPNSHLMHTIFGYRYLVWSVLALLAFARRLETGRAQWMVVAGLLLGVGAFFRLEPVFAAGCGLGFGVLAAHREWRLRMVDWGWLAAGILVVFVPLLLWASATIGIPVLWREIVTRPATMLLEQSLPLPPLDWPDGFDRIDIRKLFVALQFRLIWLLYAGYGIGLVLSVARARRRQKQFAHALLVAVWVWGAVFFSRSLTRSDEPHLDSVIPPVCVLVAHLACLAFSRLSQRLDLNGFRQARAEILAATFLVSTWVFLIGSDLWIPQQRRGNHPIAALDNRVEVHAGRQAELTDLIIRRLRLTDPGARILDLTASPLYVHLSNRRGYGANDLVMPGTFLTPDEASDFLEHVRRDPPALVIWPKQPFDRDPTKALDRTAPALASWVKANYVRWGLERRHYLMGPRDAQPPAGW